MEALQLALPHARVLYSSATGGVTSNTCSLPYTSLCVTQFCNTASLAAVIWPGLLGASGSHALRFPEAFVAAPGATEPHNLAYMLRLGHPGFASMRELAKSLSRWAAWMHTQLTHTCLAVDMRGKPSLPLPSGLSPPRMPPTTTRIHRQITWSQSHRCVEALNPHAWPAVRVCTCPTARPYRAVLPPALPCAHCRLNVVR